jgi:hypothetical protein
MITWAKNCLNDGESGSVRLKVTYDKNGYTQVSKNGIFVESMSIEQSQIKLWKNDLIERPVKADVEKPIDPLAPTSTPVTETTDTVQESVSTGADDLPF